MSQVPPHNLDLEATLISTCILDETGNAYARAATVVHDDDWYSPAHKHIWKAIGELVASSRPVDTHLVVERLQRSGRLAEIGGIPFLTRLVEQCATVAHVEQYAADVHKLSRVRAMITTARRIASEGYGAIADVDAWLADSAESIVDLAGTAKSGSLRPMTAVMRDAMRNIGETREARGNGNGVSGLSTGFAGLDALLDGTRDGDFVIMGARPGVGKSSLALRWAYNVALSPGHAYKPGVIFLSLEMPDIQQAHRGIAMDSNLRLSAIRGGHFNTSHDEHVRCANAAQNLSTEYMWMSDSPGASLADVRATIRKVRSSFDRMITPDGRPVKLKLLVIDYLQLMRGVQRKNGNREQEISEISRGLKEIAKENGITVLALAQLNRGLESRADKRPITADLRESGSLEQDADTIMFIYRDAMYNPPELADGELPPEHQLAEVIVSKHRNGPTGVAYMDFHSVSTKFSDWEGEIPRTVRPARGRSA